MTRTELEAAGIPWPGPVEGEPLVRCTWFSKPATSCQPVYGIKGPRPERTYVDEEFGETVDRGWFVDRQVITRTDEELAKAIAAWERIGDDGLLGFAPGPPQSVDATFETASGLEAEMLYNGRWIVCSWSR